MWTGNLHTALSSLRHNKWRSMLTMLGIVIGITSVVTVVSLGEGLKHELTGQIGRLGSDVVTVRPGKLTGDGSNLNFLALFSTSTLSTDDVNKLSQLKSVKSVVPINFVTSTVKADDNELSNVFVGGTTPEITNILHQPVQYGSFFQSDEGDSHFAVIGSRVASQLFGEFNPVGQSLEVQGESYIVRGVMSPASGGFLSLPEADLNSSVLLSYKSTERINKGHTNILQIFAEASDPNNLDKTVADINQTLTKAHEGQRDFTVLKQQELLKVANGMLNVITGFISGIAAISLLVAGIGIMDIMLVSVSERTREIGVRKAVGATNKQILNQFLVEGLVMSTIGGLIGILVSLLIYFLLHVYTNLDTIISWPIVGLAVGVSIAVGVIFSVAPALKAARKDPIEALRGD
jgi:putative ABC transport system permease protein